MGERVLGWVKINWNSQNQLDNLRLISQLMASYIINGIRLFKILVNLWKNPLTESQFICNFFLTSVFEFNLFKYV